MKNCVIVVGVRTANCRAHSEKGWFRNVLPDELLKAVYLALFKRNPQVKPEEIRMGITAKKVAEIYRVNRKEMELHACYSHKRAVEARDAGKFADEIITVNRNLKSGHF